MKAIDLLEIIAQNDFSNGWYQIVDAPTAKDIINNATDFEFNDVDTMNFYKNITEGEKYAVVWYDESDDRNLSVLCVECDSTNHKNMLGLYDNCAQHIRIFTLE